MKKTVWITALMTALVLTACSSWKKPAVRVADTAPSETEALAPSETETKETPSKPQTDIPSQPSTISPFPDGKDESEADPPAEAYETGCKLVLASDIHYLAKDQTDFKEGFDNMIEHGDGKVVQYIWEITDAFIEEVIREKPDVLILSGDLTLNGEKSGHIEFAQKLKTVEDAGIPVLVIPGNHDLNNPHASYFEGKMLVKTASIGPEEFARIYGDYGYDEAVSRDPVSLSYVYQIDEYNRAMMLDSCQYENGNLVGGVIREETYGWIEAQMEDAWDQGMNVIPVAHHNLLDESEVYVEDCTIEHSERLIGQMESWDVPLFLSGHLHVQHAKRSEEGGGIYEIVSSSLATPPCQYGVLYYGDDASFKYRTRQLDMAGWAKRHGMDDENLLNFEEFRKEFLGRVFYNQAQDEFARLDAMKNLSDYQKDQMAKVYAELNSACYAGKVVDVKEKESKKTGYKLWEEYGYPSILQQYVEWIVRDGNSDYNRLESDG